MRTTHFALAAIALLLAGAPAARAAAQALPPAAADAIESAFPNAAVSSVERETENGVPYYEVNLIINGSKTEVEVDPYGGIGEIERRVPLDALPEPLAEAIARATQDGGSARVERHERWGVARGDRFVKLDTPRVFYEIGLRLAQGRLSAKWIPSQPISLPEQVAAAVKAAFPGAVIVDAEAEDEDGLRLYEVELLQAGRDIEVEVSPDGVIVEVETEASLRQLPRAVLDTIQRAAQGGTIREVERTEIRAVAKDGKFVPLSAPRVVYEADLLRGDQRAEIEVAADGAILEQPDWKKLHDDDDDDDEDDDDDDHEENDDD